MIDIHNHIIYGIDDGAKTIEDSMSMLRMAYYDGIKGVFATSHYYREKFDYDLKKMDELFSILVKRIEEESIPIKIYLGHEAYLDEYLLDSLLTGKCKTLNGSRYVLIEIFKNMPLQLIKKLLFDIQLKGYIPIIAHCERLVILKKDTMKITALREMGCYMQVNVSTLFDKNRLWFKRWLIQGLKEAEISFISSDAHNHSNRKIGLRAAYDFVKKKIGPDLADDIFIYNPKKIILDEPLYKY